MPWLSRGERKESKEDEADADAARLADGMARKAAILDLPYSGGKTVIRGTPEAVKSEAVWATLGSAINQLDGRYVGGEDVNMSVADIDALRRHTPYLAGTSNGCGNPAPFAISFSGCGDSYAMMTIASI